jgi:acyl-CoA synthetase (AMP-forming)/AMP-acid ligase II
VQPVLGVDTEVFRRRHASLRDMLRTGARVRGDKVYIAAPDRDYSFAKVARLAGHVARRLETEFGVAKGDRVAIAGANSAEYTVAAWATIALGAIFTGLNGWWTAAELQYGIELTTPKLILADPPRAARLGDVDLGGAPLLDLATILDDLPDGPSELPDAPIDEDDPFLILFTSGTTGRPKGAVLSHRAFIHFSQASNLSAAIASHAAGVKPDPTFQPSSLMVGPLFHISGVVPLTFSVDNGTKQVMPLPGRWSEITHFELTVKHRLSLWSGVPTQFWRLLQHPAFDSYDTSSVRSSGGGGANFPPDLIRLFHEKMPQVILRNGYGMSESAGMGTSIGGPLFDAFPDSVGVANPAIDVEIRDDDGNTVPEGEVGEICLRGACIFLGYWNNPRATSDAFHAGRWYRTGDYGRVEDGMLYLESRVRDMIIRAGENIYPTEIENRLIEHPSISDVAVIGVPHRVLGQEVMAVVVRHAGAVLGADAVRAFAAAALSAYKVPAHVVFRDALPYTESGKVLKHQLERELIENA